MKDTGQDDLTWFSKHFKELGEQYPKKWLAIKDSQVYGVGDTMWEAHKEATEKGIKCPLMVGTDPAGWETNDLHGGYSYAQMKNILECLIHEIKYGEKYDPSIRTLKVLNKYANYFDFVKEYLVMTNVIDE